MKTCEESWGSADALVTNITPLCKSVFTCQCSYTLKSSQKSRTRPNDVRWVQKTVALRTSIKYRTYLTFVQHSGVLLCPEKGLETFRAKPRGWPSFILWSQISAFDTRFLHLDANWVQHQGMHSPGKAPVILWKLDIESSCRLRRGGGDWREVNRKSLAFP